MTFSIHRPGTFSPTQDEWQVWLQMVDGNPIDQHESMVIGTGTTRNDAVGEAILELSELTAKLAVQLQSTP